MKEPVYPEDSKEGVPGQPKVDLKNPDPAKRKAPLVGMQILSGLVKEGRMSDDGTIYDPKMAKPIAVKPSL